MHRRQAAIAAADNAVESSRVRVVLGKNVENGTMTYFTFLLDPKKSAFPRPSAFRPFLPNKAIIRYREIGVQAEQLTELHHGATA